MKIKKKRVVAAVLCVLLPSHAHALEAWEVLLGTALAAVAGGAVYVGVWTCPACGGYIHAKDYVLGRNCRHAFHREHYIPGMLCQECVKEDATLAERERYTKALERQQQGMAEAAVTALIASILAPGIYYFDQWICPACAGVVSQNQEYVTADCAHHHFHRDHYVPATRCQACVREQAVREERNRQKELELKRQREEHEKKERAKKKRLEEEQIANDRVFAEGVAQQDSAAFRGAPVSREQALRDQQLVHGERFAERDAAQQSQSTFGTTTPAQTINSQRDAHDAHYARHVGQQQNQRNNTVTLTDRIFTQDEMQEDCVICSEKLCNKDGVWVDLNSSVYKKHVTTLPCPIGNGKHTFHTHCLKEWANTCRTSGNTITCPLCRAPFEPRVVFKDC